MKAFLAAALLFWLIATIIPADAGKGGGGKPGTCDWQVYYECLAMGGDRLECLSRCMR